MRHSLSYRDKLKSSNTVAAAVSAAELKTRCANQSSTTSLVICQLPFGASPKLQAAYDALRDKGPSLPPALCCHGTNVARSTADVGEAVLSTSSLAAAFSSIQRDNG